MQRKTAVLESLFNKLAGLQHSCFPVNIFTEIFPAKFLRKAFFIEHVRWLFPSNHRQYEKHSSIYKISS